MMPHPIIWFDNTERRPRMKIKWGALAKFLIKWAPGIVEAIMRTKAQPPNPPAK